MGGEAEVVPEPLDIPYPDGDRGQLVRVLVHLDPVHLLRADTREKAARIMRQSEGNHVLFQIQQRPQGDIQEVARTACWVEHARSAEAIVERAPVAGVSAIAEEVSALRGTKLVVVDGLHALLPGTRETEEEAASAIRALKQLAMDSKVVVFVTAPLPALGARDDRRPVLDDFGARGAVKERADVVLALFREEMYDSGRGIEGATELLVRKNRNGGTGYVDLYFYAQWMRFEDMLDPDR